MKQLWSALQRWWFEPIPQATRVDWLNSADDEHILALLFAAVGAVSAMIVAAALAWVLL